MARKPKKEEHVNHERWLVSYADFITLLFAFFTALYAMSTLDAKKAIKFTNSAKQAFKMDIFDNSVMSGEALVESESNESSPDVTEHDNADIKEDASIKSTINKFKGTDNRFQLKGGQFSNLHLRDGDSPEFVRLFQEIETRLRKKLKLSDMANVNVVKKDKYVTIKINESALFEGGQATLTPKAAAILTIIGEEITKHRFNIRIEGHTDDSPIAGKSFRSNWELSAARAISVINFFGIEFSYPPDHMHVAAFASYGEVDETSSDPKMRRRVDIVITDAPASGDWKSQKN